MTILMNSLPEQRINGPGHERAQYCIATSGLLPVCKLVRLVYLATASASSNFTDNNFETPSPAMVTP